MDISLEITKLIKDTLKKINIEDANFIVEIPNNKTNGDYSTNVAMELTKKLHKNPIIRVNYGREEKTTLCPSILYAQFC